MVTRRLPFIFVPLVLWAHPMGNFSVNHYARIDLQPQSASTLTYVLDLAEIPTFELFQQWKLEEPTPALVQSKAQHHAAQWLNGLELTNNGQRLRPRLRQVKTQMTDGAGGMPVVRIETISDLPVDSGRLQYKDGNYAARAGWKEIVIRRGNGVSISQSSVTTPDRSSALTNYPTDVLTAPPQDLEASVTYDFTAVPTAPLAPPPVIALPDPAPQPGDRTTLTKGDYLSRLLKNQNLTTGMMLLGLIAAFGLGAMHALSPGHGKTIVAAYLVGTRGTLKHALFLGAMVTATHTVSVFLLGIGVLFAQQYVVPERIIPILGAISGLSIVCIGAYLLYQRTMHLAGHDHHHHHEPVPELEFAAVAGQPSFLSKANHSHPIGFAHTHTHDGHTHTHAMPTEITIKSLIALGASGGLVPCPSALILMLSAIAVGHTALGLALLVSFSAGLALVLMAIGGLVIYAKHLLPERSAQHPVFRLVPIFSAAVVMILGTLMTITSLS